MSLSIIVIAAVIWSAILWAAASLLCRLRPSASTAQAIWRGAAALMVLPFLAAPFMPGFQGEAMTALTNNAVTGGMAVAPDMPIAITPEAAATGFQLPSLAAILMAVLAAGWIARFACFMRGQIRLQRVKRLSIPSPLTSNTWASRLGLSRAPDVRYIPHGSPFVAGIGRRHIYLPEPLGNGCDTGQIIAHECTHLKRGDLITRPIERLVADLFWFSPFSWAMRERLDYWREAAVDAEAVKLTGDRIAYARALTLAARLARPMTAMPVAAFILPKEGTLKMRLTGLLNETPPRRSKIAIATAAAGLLLVPLALAQGNMLKGEQPADLPRVERVAPPEAAAAPEAPAAPKFSYTHPVMDKAKLTSHYGLRKNHKTGEPGWHNGVDLAEEMGKPAYAPMSGEVVFAGEKEGYGKAVDLKMLNGKKARYAHLKKIKVKVGDTVSGGDYIGLIGNTGAARTSGGHLHFEIWDHGKPYDPVYEPGLVLAKHLHISEKAKAHRAMQLRADQEQAEARANTPKPKSCDEAFERVDKRERTDSWKRRVKAGKVANAVIGVPKFDDNTPYPEMATVPKVTYPPEAAKAKLEGACIFLLDIAADGTPENGWPACSDPVFTKHKDKLKGLKFKPTLVNGKPVALKAIEYPMTFCLK